MLFMIYRKNVERRALLENMEGLFLAVDEIVDGGYVRIWLHETCDTELFYIILKESQCSLLSFDY